ncbi:MAG: hypothetical protein GY715_22295 [Planctomycetes bacterium]|nr:hypothetical protein [Planctomycetota bacterium]
MADKPDMPATGQEQPGRREANPGGGRAVEGTAAASRDRRPEGPRRVRNGIKLKARDGVVSREGLAAAWIDAVEAAIGDIDELTEGLRYAKIGQTIALDAEPGGIRGRVQDRAAEPCAVRIAVEPFSEVQWDRVVTDMAGEAVYLVKLLNGELPEGLDELLETHGLALLPGRPEDVKLTCSCQRGGTCRHVAAVAYLFAEQLAADPVVPLTLRGMPAAGLLERLRQARVLIARGVASAHVEPMIARVQPPPLEECVEEFWRPRPDPAAGLETPPVRHVPHALLRRLGPSPLNGRFPLVGLLASIYDRVAEYAVDLRDRAERIRGE